MDEVAKIGVIDSGYGGLSFIRMYADRGMKNHEVIYVGDNARAPYGVRSQSELFTFSVEIIDYLIQKFDIEVIILACNTLATNVLNQLRAQYEIPIYGISQQLFEKPRSWKQPIGVIATEATVNSAYFQEKFTSKELQSIVISAQPLVEMVEQQSSVDHEILQEILNPLKPVQTLILGCTHFPFVRTEIESYFSNISVIDPAEALLLPLEQLRSEDKVRIFSYITSGDVEVFQQFLDRNKLPKGEIQYEDFTCIK